MALRKNCSTKLKCGGLNTSDAVDEELGIVRCTGAMGKKRILVSSYKQLHGCPFRTPMKKLYRARFNPEQRSVLEALPQDILVKILCGVDHEDLNQLFHVSKALREATLIAKGCHFAFCTPSSKTISVKPFSDLEDSSTVDGKEEAPPNAPKQQRGNKSRISGKKLADITVALFRSPEGGEHWSRKRKVPPL